MTLRAAAGYGIAFSFNGCDQIFQQIDHGRGVVQFLGKLVAEQFAESRTLVAFPELGIVIIEYNSAILARYFHLKDRMPIPPIHQRAHPVGIDDIGDTADILTALRWDDRLARVRLLGVADQPVGCNIASKVVGDVIAVGATFKETPRPGHSDG